METDIILKKCEKCYSKFAATKLDSETNYSDFFKESNEEDGLIYITSQRFIFKGNKKTKTIPMDKILACNNEEYTITITPENGEAITYDTKNILALSACKQILAIINEEEILPVESNAELIRKKELEEQSRAVELETRQNREKMALEKEQRKKSLIVFSAIGVIIIILLLLWK